MADTPTHPEGDEDAGPGPDRESTTGTPRWAKLFGIVALALVLLVAILLITDIGGGHGPSRHAPSDGSPGGHTSRSSVTED